MIFFSQIYSLKNEERRKREEDEVCVIFGIFFLNYINVSHAVAHRNIFLLSFVRR